MRLQQISAQLADKGSSQTADHNFDAVIAAGEFVGQNLAAEKSTTPSFQAGHLTGAAGRHAGRDFVASARITGVLHAPSHADWRRRLAANRGWLATNRGWLAAGRGGITTGGTSPKSPASAVDAVKRAERQPSRSNSIHAERSSSVLFVEVSGSSYQSPVLTRPAFFAIGRAELTHTFPANAHFNG